MPLRIIAGLYRGRRLPAEIAGNTRPTSDRVREALASALQARDAFEGAQVLDLFAGTGALGFEALSRGALHVTAVDNDRSAQQCLQDNARALGVQHQLTTVTNDALKDPRALITRLQALAKPPFSLLFADPPYAHTVKLGRLLEALVSASLCAPEALLVVERASATAWALPASWTLVNEYRYGQTQITLGMLRTASSDQVGDPEPLAQTDPTDPTDPSAAS